MKDFTINHAEKSSSVIYKSATEKIHKIPVFGDWTAQAAQVCDFYRKEKLRKTSQLLKLFYGKHFPDGDKTDHSDFTEQRRQTLEFGVPNQLKFSECKKKAALEHS